MTRDLHMKHYLLPVSLVLLTSAVAWGQCDPLDHDWAGAAYGVSPNPQNEEPLETGYLGVPYSEVIYVKAPTLAGDIDPQYASFNLAIDSLRLEDLQVDAGSGFQSLTEIGLTLTCNNLGDAVDPCTFLGGNAYCGDVSGTPTVAGVFPVKIDVLVYITIGAPLSFPYSFEGFSLTVVDPNSVAETAVPQTLQVMQNNPNPVQGLTAISYELGSAGSAEFTVTNLVGERVYQRILQGKRGLNTFTFDSGELQNGVYLYSVSSGDRKFTRRMIVQH